MQTLSTLLMPLILRWKMKCNICLCDISLPFFGSYVIEIGYSCNSKAAASPKRKFPSTEICVSNIGLLIHLSLFLRFLFETVFLCTQLVLVVQLDRLMSLCLFLVGICYGLYGVCIMENHLNVCGIVGHCSVLHCSHR